MYLRERSRAGARTHAHACIVVPEDERIVRSIVAGLTRNYEARDQRKMSDSPKEFMEAMVKVSSASKLISPD